MIAAIAPCFGGYFVVFIVKDSHLRADNENLQTVNYGNSVADYERVMVKSIFASLLSVDFAVIVIV